MDDLIDNIELSDEERLVIEETREVYDEYIPTYYYTSMKGIDDPLLIKLVHNFRQDWNQHTHHNYYRNDSKRYKLLRFIQRKSG